MDSSLTCVAWLAYRNHAKVTALAPWGSTFEDVVQVRERLAAANAAALLAEFRDALHVAFCGYAHGLRIKKPDRPGVAKSGKGRACADRRET